MSCSERVNRGLEALDDAIHNDIAIYKRVRSIARAELGHDVPEELIMCIYANILWDD